MSNFEPPKWEMATSRRVVTVIAGVGVATFEAEIFVFRRITLDQIVQYQAGVYAILTLGFALVLKRKRSLSLQWNIFFLGIVANVLFLMVSNGSAAGSSDVVFASEGVLAGIRTWTRSLTFARNVSP